MRAVLGLVLMGGAAGAAELPPLDYFGGQYEMIGRLAEGSALVTDQARITIEGDQLILTTKANGEGWLAANPSDREGAPPLAGALAGQEMDCRFQNDGGNYPRLTCKQPPYGEAGSGGLITLWPVP